MRPNTKSHRLLIGAAATALSIGTALPGAALAGDSLSCRFDRYAASGAVRAAASPNAVDVSWTGADSQKLTMRLGVTGGKPMIEQLAINGQTVIENAGIEFRVTTGYRRISEQQLEPLKELGVPLTDAEVDEHKWDVFWDAPLDLAKPYRAGNPPPAEGVASQPGIPRNPNEIERSVAVYAADGCAVVSEGARLSVSFPKMTSGVFAGDLVLTVYQGSNLVRTEFVAKTASRSVAYKYDAGLTGLTLAQGSKVSWRDTAGMMQSYGLTGPVNQNEAPLKAANRVVVAEIGAGAIAAFPPPHTFFWAREVEINVGNNWYRKDSASTFSIGVRQAEQEVVPAYIANWSLYSAPPGTEQHMAFYFYPTLGKRDVAFNAALAFTNNDRYPELPGYKVMANHFHTNLGSRLLKEGADTRIADFEVLKSAGVQIAGIVDRPRDVKGGSTRLEELKSMFDGAVRHSDDEFVVMPNIEASEYLGGHWDVLLAKPTYWVETRKPGEALTRSDPVFGTVYNIGSTTDVMQMVEQQNMLIYMPHPRTKGSTHYPDAVKDDAPFNSDRYRGAGWRWGMGSDLSEIRLSEKRVLPLFDEMNNWMVGKPLRPKYLLSITETYKKDPGDDIYAAGPVNYIKLDKLPTGADYSSIIKVLNDGDYFVSTGEVVIPSHSLSGAGKAAVLNAEVKWTFPLDFVEVVWGDGKKTFNKVVSTKDLAPFGNKTFAVPFDATRARWVRFAAWDSAGNGAMTQPVRIGK